MNNLVKGWVTSVFGLLVMIIDVLYFFGIIQLPSPENKMEPYHVFVAFVIGLALFSLPSTWIEDTLKGWIKKKTE